VFNCRDKPNADLRLGAPEAFDIRRGHIEGYIEAVAIGGGDTKAGAERREEQAGRQRQLERGRDPGGKLVGHRLLRPDRAAQVGAGDVAEVDEVLLGQRPVEPG